MSNTASVDGQSDISERLKSAAEIDPARLPQLRAIAEATADQLTTALNRLSVEKVAVTFAGFEGSFGPELGEGEVSPPLVTELLSKRFVRPAYLKAPQSFCDACIACFFGAAPSEAKGARRITDLDRALVREAFKALADSFALSFRRIDEAGFEAARLVPGDEFAELFGGANARRHVEMSFEIRKAKSKKAAREEAAKGAEAKPDEPLSTVVLALPSSYLALHRRRLAEPMKVPEPSPDDSWSEAMIRNFEKSGLHLKAILARKRVPMRDIAHLRVGQTLPLGVKVTEAITMECEGTPIFKSQVGFARGAYVARFEETIDPTREFIDDILSH
ncbi:hypothetical protein DYI37_06945 [Fulvimarina endophytica]|uniref:Flagellar motor switch protein FliM n=1 Tax=Fulvimarina endophytica TaxID=2293836 RepID=A0A371X4Y6_9HYPH|nr:FliM/FliN family flagellar motor switch protein [Fulvimarina endophytica]RFC64094.1 hypothetical protein DYI37_06945 [Fulvimarina endophytica]